ncbi:MAG: alpha/beta fold hydrolase [Acidimicrobiia bacterium]
MSAPVLMLHGFGTSSARTWGDNGWLDLLRDVGREPLAVDLLGHGTAAKPHEPEAYADLEGHVRAALPPGPLDGIGFSLGARVLLGLAAAEPDRFGRIAVLGVGENLLRTDQDGGRVRRALAGDADPDDPVAHYFAGLAAHPDSDRDALLACVQAPRPVLTPELLAKVTARVLVVLGDEDPAGPAEPLVDALPDASLVTLRAVDHFATPKDFGAIDAVLGLLGEP